MNRRFKAACLQLNSGREPLQNITATSDFARAAVSQGANLVLTPEVTDMLEPRRHLREEKLRAEAQHPGVAAFSDLAAELKIWLAIGSMLVAREGGKPANRSYLFAPDGAIAARYDKIHMFDVDIPDGQSYRESNAYQAGDRAVLASLPWGTLGLTICYDLRFPELYQALALAGADFLTVPSAFTRYTGQAHWHSLLRARAIETGCYLFAAAQCGVHAEGRESYGHSLIVSPWGDVLADGGEEPGVVLADIDTAEVAAARKRIPALAARRDFALPAMPSAPLAIKRAN